MDDVTVPMLLAGLALLLYSGFFIAAREWIQGRLGKHSATPQTAAPQQQQQSLSDLPNATGLV